MEYNPGLEGGAGRASRGKAGAPYRYPGTLVMPAACMVGMGARHGQPEGAVGRMIGESRTPSSSQLRKRMGRLDVGTDRGGVITVSDPEHSRILAADATGLKQHNRGEWMGKKWRVKRGFVERHVMVDAQAVRIVALPVTDETAGDVTEFRSLPGQSMDAIGENSGTGGASGHSKDPGPDTPARKRGDGSPSRHPLYQNRLASGISPLAPSRSDRPYDDPAAADIVYGDAAYGSGDSVAACARAWFRASCTGST